MIECKNSLLADFDTYTQEQYEVMEKELTESLNKTVKDFKNKYCVQPFLTVEEVEKISVFIVNKATRNTFKV